MAARPNRQTPNAPDHEPAPGLSTIMLRTAQGAALAGGALLGLVVAVTMLNVGGFTLNAVARPFGGSVTGLPGYEDAVSLLVGLAVLLMLPWCQVQRGHVAVDTLLRYAPATISDALSRGIDAVMAAIALFLVVMLATAAIEAQADGRLTPVLGWPVWPFLWPGVVALLFWSAIALLMAVAPRSSAEGLRAIDDGRQ